MSFSKNISNNFAGKYSQQFLDHAKQYMNYDSRGMYNTNSRIKFKTLILKLRLCHYSDAYLLVKGTKRTTRIERLGTTKQRKTAREASKRD